MNSIIYDDKVIMPKGDIWGYYNNFIKKLDVKDCVKLSLFCAKYVNPNTKESNVCINLVEKWLIDENSVSKQELDTAASTAAYAAYADADYSADAVWYAAAAAAVSTVSASNATFSVYYAAIYYATVYYAAIDKINKYLQILLRKTQQFGNNKVLEQISKTDVDKLELVDWNMITDIMLEEYNIVHEFDYSDIFSRRCLIELLRREYV